MRVLAVMTLALAAGVTGCSGTSRLLAEVPDSQKAARNVPIDITAAARLNTTSKGQSLALLARVYKLRQRAAFDQASYDTFLSPGKEQEAFGADLLEVKEVMLIPGQHYKVTEKVSREAGFIGVVALFNKPAPQRWRMSFAAAELEKTGLSMGAHACSLTAGAASTPARCPGQ